MGKLNLTLTISDKAILFPNTCSLEWDDKYKSCPENSYTEPLSLTVQPAGGTVLPVENVRCSQTVRKGVSVCLVVRADTNQFVAQMGSCTLTTASYIGLPASATSRSRSTGIRLVCGKTFTKASVNIV